jgi:cation transport ATPase
MKRNAIKLSRPHEWSVYVILALSFVSGAVWAWLHHFGRVTSEFGVIAHPTELWMQRLHGAAAMLVLVLFGTLLLSHMLRAWRARRNRRTGMSLVITLGILIGTGYALYYLGNEQLRAWASWGHLWVGLALPLIVALHVLRGKQSR